VEGQSGGEGGEEMGSCERAGRGGGVGVHNGPAETMVGGGGCLGNNMAGTDK